MIMGMSIAFQDCANMEGWIVKIVSNQYTVKVGHKFYECRARGRFRKDCITPLVGDKCMIDVKNHYILEILPRENYLTRPMIANVDIALVVTSLKKPDLSFSLLDKTLSIIISNHIKPMICFTKADLLDASEIKEMKKIAKYYESIGIPCVFNTEKSKINAHLKNSIVVVTGQTGAGKSTLINSLDHSLDLKTSPISEALGRGVHTTRHVELYPIKDYYIADTPGFSALDFKGLTKEDIRNTFPEFATFECKFGDCMHVGETNCVVKDRVNSGVILKSRYDNYVGFLKEVQK